MTYWVDRMSNREVPVCGEPEAGCRLSAGNTGWISSLGRKLVLGLLALSCVSVSADVRETPHNLIKSRDKSVSEKLVCVFCHTPVNEEGDMPVGTDGVGGVMAPRWQKSLADGFVFTIYDDIGRLGLGKPSAGSQSMACLSCHDSNQALTISATSSNHPFGVPYRGATKHMSPGSVIVTPKADSSTPFRAARHLFAFEDFREASQGTVEDRAVFWVSRNGITARRTRNDLPLYGRASDVSDVTTEAGILVPHIECSSCHDPHAKTETFLRVSSAGSQLCLTCHDK